MPSLLTLDQVLLLSRALLKLILCGQARAAEDEALAIAFERGGCSTGGSIANVAALTIFLKSFDFSSLPLSWMEAHVGRLSATVIELAGDQSAYAEIAQRVRCFESKLE